MSTRDKRWVRVDGALWVRADAVVAVYVDPDRQVNREDRVFLQMVGGTSLMLQNADPRSVEAVVDTISRNTGDEVAQLRARLRAVERERDAITAFLDADTAKDAAQYMASRRRGSSEDLF